MNFLAHIFLAQHSEEAMLGAMLGDFVKADVSGKFNPQIELEIKLHRKVDVFTDSHPIVIAAKQSFDEARRRFAGIALDVFYDHVLANNWSSYSDIPLLDFTQNFYAGLIKHQAMLPANLALITPRMREQDWLGSYQDFAGVEVAITRISTRLSKNGHLLREGLIDLRANYAALSAGFASFFPELIQFAEQQRDVLSASLG
ncbi:MAG: ACP phosphodiesterase [Pseudomonadota bacterium]